MLTGKQVERVAACDKIRKSDALPNRLQNRHALHMRSHREDVGLGKARKRAGQNHSGRRLAHHAPHHFPGRHNGVMPSSPQHPAPAPKNLSGPDIEDLALYREKFRRRLPESLDE